MIPIRRRKLKLFNLKEQFNKIVNTIIVQTNNI